MAPLTSKPGSDTAVEGCGSSQRCCLAISAAQMIEVCRTTLFRAKELNSTSSGDELRHSKQGLKHCDWLRVTKGRPVMLRHSKKGLKMICNDFLVVKVNCWSYLFNIMKYM